MTGETADTHSPHVPVIARNAKARRSESGLTVPELADLAGVSEAWLAGLESGSVPKDRLDRTALTRVAAALGTSVAGLSAPEGPGAASPSAGVPSAAADGHGLVEIGEEECYAHLKLTSVGRVAPGPDAEPFILPVNFIVDGRDIVFRTRQGSAPAGLQGLVAFQADELIAGPRLGWSVLLIGRAERVTEPDELSALREIGPTPWPDGDRPVWIRIRPRRVTGRRLSHAPAPPTALR
jgi:transcriptional regulator with XRE-family HTH domain